MTKPRGYFDLVLAIDCETSGLAYNADDPSFDVATGDTYQAVSWGLIVADARTLKPVEELYLEVQWDGVSKWLSEAQRVHGLSKEYLASNGVPMEEAVTRIGNLIVDYWGPSSPVCLLGHNVTTFDMWFLKRTMRTEGIEIPFGNRHIDTNSVGFSTFGTYNSDDLFSAIGLEDRDPAKHNALDDARRALAAVRTVKKLFSTILEE